VTHTIGKAQKAIAVSWITLVLIGCTSASSNPGTPPVSSEAIEPTLTEAATDTAAPVPTPESTQGEQSVSYPPQSERERLDPAEFPGLTLAESSDLPWWNERVFYEIFVRSFYDSDGDGIGDLQGVIEKLDYLNDGDPATTFDLGVTGIWLMPIMKSPSYHGYDVTDYFQVNPDYGTNEDFKALMVEAHDRGIVVIVDLVLNHTSSQHPWFQASRNDDPDYFDWYIWDETNPTYKGPWGQDVWHRVGDESYYGIFTSGMPDLNYRNPEVTDQMEEVSRFWLEEMGADGFRLDAIKHLVEDGRVQQDSPSTVRWLYDYNDAIDEINPDALTVGEVWSPSASIARYVVDGVDIAFEFDYATAIIDSVRDKRADSVNRALRNILNIYPAGQFATFLTNHDQNRVMNQVSSDAEAAKTAATILLTGPGVPFIYYGEEIGMQGSKPDERIRTPMHWTDDPINAGFSAEAPWQILTYNVERYNVADEDSDPDSLLNHYRTLISLRNQYAALHLGDTAVVESDNPAIYAVMRYVQEQAVMVVINLDDEPVSGFSLTLEESPLMLSQQPVRIFGNRSLNSITITDTGGFIGYSPVSRLDGRESIIILFE
jgi:alpha-amylase